MQNISDAKKLYTETMANCMESQEKWLAFLDFAAKFQMPQSLHQHGFSTQLAVYGSPHSSEVCLTEDDWAVYDRYVLSNHDSIPVLGTDFGGNTVAVSLIPQESTADFDESAPTPLPNFTLDLYAAQVQSSIASKHDMPTDISLAETLREVIYHELSELPMTQKAAEFAQNTMLYQLCSRYGITPDRTLDFSYLDDNPSLIDIARIGQNINTVLFPLEQSIENAIATERSYEYEPRREAGSMDAETGDAAAEQRISGGFVSAGTGGTENVHGVRAVGDGTHAVGSVSGERSGYSAGNEGVSSSGGGLGESERRTELAGETDGTARDIREPEIRLSEGTQVGAVSGAESVESTAETLQRDGENHESESGFAGGTLETDGRSVSESGENKRFRAENGTVEQLHRFGGGNDSAGNDIRIIGNTAIQDIPEKRMTAIDAEIAIQVTEKLESLSVSYACSILDGSDMATLYIPKQDMARCCRVIADTMDAASEQTEVVLHVAQPDEALRTAINSIEIFYNSEYGDTADTSNYSHISLAYTTTEDETREIQIYANLNDYTIVHTIDGEVYHTEQYEDLTDMNLRALSVMTFDSLISDTLYAAENVLHVAHSEKAENTDAWDDKDRIYYDAEREELTWVYYNPDSIAGGQLVIDTFDTNLLKAAMNDDKPLDYIHSGCYQTLCDIDASDFAETVRYYMEKEAQCVTDSDDTAAQLSYFRELHAKLTQEDVLHVAQSDSIISNTKELRLPCYLHDFGYAREHDEIDAYKENAEENHRCRAAISKAISDFYDINSYTLDSDGAWDVLTASFTEERITMILVTNLSKIADHDARISESVGQWAKGQYAQIPEEIRDAINEYILNDSSGLLNIMGKKVMKVQQEACVQEQQPDYTYEIYQLRDTDEASRLLFVSYDDLTTNGDTIKRENYKMVYSGSLDTADNDIMALDQLYEQFNLHHPEDYKGHSLSVSDVIVLTKDGKQAAYYTDSIGFYKAPEFLLALDEKKAIDDADILKNLILDGSGFECGKYRIAKFYHDNQPTNAELATMLKDEYGIGGYSGNDEMFRFIDYDSKGIRVQLADASQLQFSWSQVAKETATLLESNSYLSQKDIDSLIADGKEDILDLDSDDFVRNRAVEMLAYFGVVNYPVSVPFYVKTVGEAKELGEIAQYRDNVNISKSCIEFITTKMHEYYAENNLDGLVTDLSERYGIDRALQTLAYTVQHAEWDARYTDEVKEYARQYAIPETFNCHCSVHPVKLNTLYLKLMAAKEQQVLQRLHGFTPAASEVVLHVAQPKDELIAEITPVEVQEKPRNGYENRAYRLLEQIAPDILHDADLYYLRMESEEFEPLVIERVWDDQISIAHYYEQNGDLMRDPEVVFRVDKEHKALYPLEFQQDNPPMYQHFDGFNAECRDVLQFCVNDWLPNIQNQNQPLARAVYDYAGEEVTLHYRPNGTIMFADAVSEGIKNAFLQSRSFSITEEKHNFHLTAEDIGLGNTRERCHNNIAAIRTLKTIEAEGRLATEEEQKILAKYVGWGGLQDALDPRQTSWEKEYNEIRSLLTDREYATASRSVLTAFYTPPVVIDAIYDKLQDMGFHGGRVLEPSMGIGNFYGCMPQSMQEQSELHGVEIDEISGRIARQLYQTADVEIKAFQNTKFQNGSFDVVISNVPFDTLKVKDKEIGNSFMLHDYFFAKSLEKVKDGGIIAFITSTGTMDKQNPAVRKYIAERADLLGAVRLPSGTFGESAGTKVDADVIFLKKRSKPLDIEPEWVQSRQDRDINGREYRMNAYFLEHPEMYLGSMGYSNRFGEENASTVCFPDGRDLKEMLQEAFQNIKGEISQEPATVAEQLTDEVVREIRPAPLDMAEGSFDVIDGKLFKRMGDIIESQDMPRGKTTPRRIQGMKQIADITQHLLEIQQNPETTDDTIIQTQAQLRAAYESFVAKYGAVNSRENARIFSSDSRSPLLHSLEIIKNGDVVALADIFTKRTIIPHTAPTQADSAVEALGFSISEKAAVDIDYMMQLTSKSQAEIVSDLRGIIFQNPKTGKYEMQDEYLSGNIRVKLAEAKEAAQTNSSYQLNVDALEKAMPERLDASDIQVRLGATWIPVQYYEQFMKETFHLQSWQVGRHGMHITFCPQTAEWAVLGKINVQNVQVNEVFGTSRRDAFDIFADCLNLKATEVHDTFIDVDGKRRSVKNVEETEAAQRCQDMLQEEFANWIFEDPNRRYELVDIYNEKYNSTVPRQYDGSHLIFPNMNPTIVMKDHQRGAIAHAIYGDNTLFAHEVGAGKTYEMIASIMEGKRLGRHQKSLMCVPNHLTEQAASDFLKLYPAANILVATADDFSAQNRKRFCARVATGNYDAVIMGHSHLRHIPLSHERQVKYYQQEIDAAREALLLAPDKESRKMIERQVQRLEEKLTKLLAIDHDDAVTFEQMGFDQLVLDEAHEFKNLFLITKMSNVSGISTNDNVEKTVDLYMKCKYMDELERGQIIFATATPVANSVTEIYTMMRYLQADTLKDMGMGMFDAWASTFGKTVTDLQLAPEGKGYRAKTRFAEFYNLPELMRVFKECADIKVADELNLDVPECETHIVTAEPTKIQLDMIDQLSTRAEAVHNHTVDSSVDNMLVITSDGKKIGLDQRAIDTALPDDPHSKVNLCIENVYKIWDENAEQKATQIIFCDMCTPSASKTKAASSEGEASGNDVDINDSALSQSKFNVYEDIRQKLIAKGVPAEQIAFIHDAKTELQKEALYQKMRDGDVRVLLGSTIVSTYEQYTD